MVFGPYVSETNYAVAGSPYDVYDYYNDYYDDGSDCDSNFNEDDDGVIDSDLLTDSAGDSDGGDQCNDSYDLFSEDYSDRSRADNDIKMDDDNDTITNNVSELKPERRGDGYVHMIVQFIVTIFSSL